MSDDSRVADLLADRPDLESALADVLAVDEEQGTWTFDDVPVDSGAFGELVARDIVVEEGGDYRLADPDRVRAVLAGDSDGESTAGDTAPEQTSRSPDFSFPSLDARGVGMVAAALAFVALMRSLVAGSVFRGEHVVLSANDPYYYRYLVEQTVSGGAPPSGIDTGEPLLVATLAALSDLLGGVNAAGAVLAIYPVAAAVVTAGLLYWLSLRITDDRRVALAAVVMLAITPGNALRTGLGFADHHAFDYVWLILTATALVALAGIERREQLQSAGVWLAAAALGVGIGFQTLAWNNGPLMLVPVGLFLAARVVLDVRSGRSPALGNAPALAGIALGAALAVLGHVVMGWHSWAVVLTPALLLGGGAGVVAAGELARALDLPARLLAVGEAAVGLVAVAAVWLFLPSLMDRVLRGLGLIGRTDPIAEVQALFSGDTLGFLLLFGFVLVLALPVLGWASWQVIDGSLLWLVPVAYGWYFFLLALFQVRFTGQLAYFTALFAGLAFVWLAAKVDVARLPVPVDGDGSLSDWTPGRPDATTVGAVFFLFLLVGGLGVLQTAVKVEQVAIDDASYETAAWLDDYADDRGWTAAEESYVLSNWGRNRMFNYFVNGESRSYGYAQSIYGDFIAEGDPARASSMLDDRVRFVVTQNLDAQEQTIQARLHEHFGSRNGAIEGAGQFRAVFASDGGTRKAFLHVPGANVTGRTAANATVSLSTSVEIQGASFTYERQVTASADGQFGVRVPYPGTYNVSTPGDTWTVTVNETAVMDGLRVESGS